MIENGPFVHPYFTKCCPIKCQCVVLLVVVVSVESWLWNILIVSNTDQATMDTQHYSQTSQHFPT